MSLVSRHVDPVAVAPPGSLTEVPAALTGRDPEPWVVVRFGGGWGIELVRGPYGPLSYAEARAAVERLGEDDGWRAIPLRPVEDAS